MLFLFPQGIWTCIPWEARITIIFYWSVPIKLELETVTLFGQQNDPNDLRLSVLICERQRALYGIKCVLRISWQTWLHIYCTNKLFWAFTCNFFFKISKNMKRWWDAILQNKIMSISLAPLRGYGLISPAWLTNQITGLAKIFHSSRYTYV